ncbi:MAG: acyl-ACP--UDP-N-acetylglucosamine O-acyltransferase [Acetobacteraceae bacterium]|nr:acyl-ACP--UDP-N-acetylglucosamine O-acyltransferase [Acetobacteraceae bacterium]
MIHPSAVIARGAEIGSGVQIGPFCAIGANVVIGDGVELVSHVVIDGHTHISSGVKLYPFSSIGLAPQDIRYKDEPTRCVIGARSQIREHCSIHRGTPTGLGVTTVGTDCILMAVTHVAHDCTLGNGVIVANNVVMGGHVWIGDNAIIGGQSAIHQFTRIGRGAMIGGVTGVEADVVPFGMVVGNRGLLTGLNVIGLTRLDYERPRIHRLRAAFRLLFAGKSVFAERLVQIRAQFADEPLVTEMLAFIDQPSKRGLIHASLSRDQEGK